MAEQPRQWSLEGLSLPPSVLVTGCGGFIGSRTTALLLEGGVRVAGIDCLIPELTPVADKAARVARLAEHPGFSFHQLDLSRDDLSPVTASDDPVIHLAAMVGLEPSWSRPGLYEEHNVVATRRLLDAMAATGGPRHLVHASTSSVYGTRAVGDETAALSPASPYGTTKLAAEELVAGRVEAGAIEATVLRYFSVYGPGQRPDMAYAKAIAAILAGEEMPIHGDGSQRRSNTYVDDAAMAAILAVALRPSTTCNIAGRRSVTLLDAIGNLERVLGRPARLAFLPPARGDQRETEGDCTKALEVLGWSARTEIEDGLRLQAEAALDHARTGARS
jgi:nucleoside-diphosphate-sugar epimerase